ncbi:MAG: Mur ligase domain-containing protein, partial [Ilumatobacteraceae bacterium]
MTTIAEVVRVIRGGPSVEITGDDAVPVTDITIDSREVRPGTVFCCVRGEHHDGHDFAAE